MPTLNGAAVFAAQAIINDSPTFFTNANARIAVGNGDDAFSVAHTDLQGVSKIRKAMEASYPQRTGAVITLRSVFNADEANFRWEEFGVVNDATAGTMLNRKVGFLGEKTAASIWQLTLTLEIVNADDI
jgi:hypothetical protein